VGARPRPLPPARTGRPPRDRREILDGVLWILRTGAPWRDLPEELGPWVTVWDLFDAWNHDGTLDAILSQLRSAVAPRPEDERRISADRPAGSKPRLTGKRRDGTAAAPC